MKSTVAFVQMVRERGGRGMGLFIVIYGLVKTSATDDTGHSHVRPIVPETFRFP